MLIQNMTGIIQGNKNATQLANFLKNAKVQYPTLSKQEEVEMIKKYEDDRETLNKLLILHNIRIVFSLAKHYMSKTNDFDGLIQDGFIGLAEAAKRFNLKMNIKFITYARIWVLKYLRMHFKSKNIEVDLNSLSLDNACSTTKHSDNENEFKDFVNEYIDPSCDTRKSITDEISSNEQITICKNLISYMNSDSSLSSTDKHVFVDIFYNREKTRDIAEKYDITMEDVNQIRHKILGKFKNVLAADYNINSYQELR